MTLIKNGISGLTYDPSNSTITFPPGTYQITFVYEGAHNNQLSTPECSVSSHFVDFPLSSGLQRVHNTSSHNAGPTSNYGGSIIYTTQLSNPVLWQIGLGRGQSGNCYGPGNTLVGVSTQLLVYRIGN